VDENVLPFITRDESEALLCVEELHRSSVQDQLFSSCGAPLLGGLLVALYAYRAPLAVGCAEFRMAQRRCI
jgi:hypothetical protein